MTKTLQKKFVVTAMAAITVLLLLLLGVINVVNSVLVSGKIQRTLEIIWQSEGGEGLLPPPDPAPRGPGEGPKNAHDTVLSSNYFLVHYDQEGAVAKVDVSRTSAVTEEVAQELAAQACAGEREGGRLSRFRYLRREAPQGGVTLVFLDISEEVFSYIRVLLLSVAAGLGCWGLMLVVVILLSRQAIRPLAENIERQKQFVTNAGHEIKTPLAIIQSNTEAMELYLGESKWSRNIKEQTRRLSGLMQNLLTLARMDQGAAPVQKTTLSLSGLAEKALEPFLQPMEAQGIALERDIQPGVTLTGDPAQLEQLLSLLLDNAVKYTGPGGRICLSVKQEGKRARLCLENTCPQLPTVPAEKLFDRFYRGDAARTQKEGGYGIGLAAARSLAQANQGSLHAQYLPPQAIQFVAQFPN